MQFRKAGRRDVSINIAPLVDVVFLLVIFFAVSTTFLETAGLELELPSSSSSATRQPEALVVTLDREGTLWFEEETWDDGDALRRRLADSLQGREDRMVTLRADEEIEHGQVVAVMDLIRGAGASGLTVAARSAAN